ncbi:MAG: DUF1292 domain-containing protein [Filifactor alocis]|nr:DUF1292 domain-containing protein [Filifactor alocis]
MDKERMYLEENIIVLTDENGEETSFELLTTLEANDKVYAVLKPLSEEQAYIFVLEYDEDKEMLLCEIEDDEEFEIVAELYENLEEE